MLNNFNFDKDNIIDFVKEKWIIIVICLGMLILVWKPVGTAKDVKSEQDNPNISNWFKTYSLDDGNVKNDKPEEVLNLKEIYINEDELNKNKEIVKDKCSKIKNIDTILLKLEDTYGKQYLYINVDRAVKLVEKEK